MMHETRLHYENELILARMKVLEQYINDFVHLVDAKYPLFDEILADDEEYQLIEKQLKSINNALKGDDA